MRWHGIVVGCRLGKRITLTEPCDKCKIRVRICPKVVPFSDRYFGAGGIETTAIGRRGFQCQSVFLCNYIRVWGTWRTIGEHTYDFHVMIGHSIGVWWWLWQRITIAQPCNKGKVCIRICPQIICLATCYIRTGGIEAAAICGRSFQRQRIFLCGISRVRGIGGIIVPTNLSPGAQVHE